MLNPKPKQDEVEWLPLDDCVSTDKGDSILYVRVRGESLHDVGIETGDLTVIQKSRKPISSDSVLCLINGEYAIKSYFDVENFDNPLRLVARNGEPVTSKLENKSFEIIGVVKHVVKTLSN